MSMSDCPKCWDTPCTCGYEWKSWSPQRLREQIAMLQKVLAEIEAPKKTTVIKIPNKYDGQH